MSAFTCIGRWLPLASLFCVLFADRTTAADSTIAEAVSPRHVSVADYGAVGNGTTLNTQKFQSAVVDLAAKGGGTLIIPKGVFLSGAIFLKPGVNLQLEKDAVLKCSTDMKNFPEQRTRIEGHFENHSNPGLINAKGCSGLHITGQGTLDGAGRPIWDQFWKLHDASKDKENFKNLSVPRARLCVIEDSKNVVIDGITFKDSQYWNLHLYRCQNALVRDARFVVPDDYKQAPSTDGVDVDSCQNISITGCYFSVTDDCICMKGTKGPFALNDKDSPPVEHVRVANCTFKRGAGAVTLGSEATVVRDVVVENCTVTGEVPVVVLKLRSDTPQLYEDIHFRGITLDSPTGVLLSANPWHQYADLQGQPPPRSTVRNITVSDVKGRFGSLGSIQGNRELTHISDITLEHISLNLKSDKLNAVGVTNLKIEDVAVNGKPFMLPGD